MAYQAGTLAQIAKFQETNQRTVRDGQFCPASTIILGSAGTAKSQWSKNEFPKIVAAARNLDPAEVAVELTQAAVRDSQEYAGIGVPQSSDAGLVTRFSIPSLIEKIEAHRTAGAKCIIVVVDEIAAGGDDIQKLFAPAADKFDHRIADHILGNDVVIIMTGNRSKDKAGSRRLLSHLPNRAAVFEIISDHDAFADYADANGFHALLTSVVRMVEDFIDEKAPTDERQACTYRQIEQSSDFLKTAEDMGNFVDEVTPDIHFGLAGFIGQDAANTVQRFANEIKQGIPTAEEIFADPLTANVPNNPASQQFAVNRATAEIGNHGPEAGNLLFDYINRLAPDLQVWQGVKAQRAAVRAGVLLNSDLAHAFNIKHLDLIELASIGD
tara:strand:- start:168 stop:1316 length:1149 start_codon:yes stop_codon:yes gene_type:complete